MNTDLVIRTAIEADASQLADFGRLTFLDTFGHLYPDEDKAFFTAERFSLARTQSDIHESGRLLKLAFTADRLVGFLDCGALGLPVEKPELGALELYRLYVSNDQKGSGLAKGFMEIAIDWAKSQGAPALYLGVFNQNDRAISFYRKFGFEIIGAYQFKVGGTLDDERIMRLAL